MGFFKDLMQQYQFNPATQEPEVETIEDAVMELQDRVRNLEALVSELLRELDESPDLAPTAPPSPQQ